MYLIIPDGSGYPGKLETDDGLDRTIRIEPVNDISIIKWVPLPCGISSAGLSENSGYAGQVILMYGTWGPYQGVKLPAINLGGLNELIVLDWTDTVLTLQAPATLAPGNYRVGVYCNPLSWGGAYSSGWMDYEIVPRFVIRDIIR